MLPADVQTAASSFHKYWTERWQDFMEDATVEDLLTVLVGQTARAFGAAIKVQANIKNLEGKSQINGEKVARAEEEAKHAKAEASKAKRLQEEEAQKLSSALAELEATRKEVGTCQGEVALMTRKVENSDNLQRITSEALEKVNNENLALKADLEKISKHKKDLIARVSGLTDEVEEARKDAEAAGSEAEKRFISNFHLTDMYQNFATYWRGYAYKDIIEWMETNLPTVNTSDMRQLFLEEGEPAGPGEEVQPVEAPDDDVIEVHNVEPLSSIPPPPPQ